MTDKCPICLLEINPIGLVTTKCNHKFHLNCINAWIQRQVRHNSNTDCPVCRDTIQDTNYEIV